MELEPKPRSASSQSSTLSSHGEVLAGESSTNKVNGVEVEGSNFGDVGEDSRTIFCRSLIGLEAKNAVS
jgi:hypothetical protein